MENNKELKIKPLFRVPTIQEIVKRWKINLGKKPYKWQAEIHQRILESIAYNYGDIIVIQVTRQFGKNELSSAIEADLMMISFYKNINMQNLKFVPGGKTQLRVSKGRLETALGSSTILRIIDSNSCVDGFKYYLNWNKKKKIKEFLENGIACQSIISAKSGVAGETATHLLEGDEAQYMDINKWDVDIEPMRNANFATIVLYGVAWTNDCMINIQKQQALEIEKETGRKCYYKITAEDACLINPRYKKAFDAALRKYGSKEHLVIKTQYMLETVDDISKMFTTEQINSILDNEIHFKERPEEGKKYAIAIDVGGEDESKTELSTDIDYKRDSTLIMIAELDFSVIDSENKFPKGNLVRIYEFNGDLNSKVYSEIANIIRFWGGGDSAKNISKVLVDSTGLGEPLKSSLQEIFGIKVEGFKFKYKGDNNKSELGFHAITYILKRLLRIPNNINPNIEKCEYRLSELIFQLENLIREAKEEEKINFFVPKTAKRPHILNYIGHDDYAICFILLTKAVSICKKPFDRKFF